MKNQLITRYSEWFSTFTNLLL